MTNETKTEDRNLLIAWFTVGLLILACVLFAIMGKWGTQGGEVGDVTAANDQQADQGNGLGEDVMLSSGIGQANSSDTSSASVKDAMASTKLVTETDSLVSADADLASQDIANSISDNGGDLDTSDTDSQLASTREIDEADIFGESDNSALDSAPGHDLDSAAATVEATDVVAVDDLSPESTASSEVDILTNQVSTDSQLSDLATSDAVLDQSATLDIVPEAPPADDPVTSAEAQNDTALDELATKLADEPTSLDNSALAESPTTDIAADTASDPVQAVEDLANQTETTQSATASTGASLSTDSDAVADSLTEGSNALSTAVADKVKASDPSTDEDAMRPFLGVGIRQTGSSVVTTLYDDSTAQQLGLRLGDRITKLNDKAITDLDSIKKALSSLKIGDETKMTVVRDGQVYEFGPAALTGRKIEKK